MHVTPTIINMSSLRSGPAGAGPVLVVRTRQSDHRLQAGTDYQLGRDPASDIVLTDTRVSWRHAVLRHEQDTWILEDAGSTNGTFVGTRRMDRITISAECVIRLGDADDGPVLRCEPAVRPAHTPTQVSGPSVGQATIQVEPPVTPSALAGAAPAAAPAPQAFPEVTPVPPATPEVTPGNGHHGPGVDHDRPAARWTPKADPPVLRPVTPAPRADAPSPRAGTPAPPAVPPGGPRAPGN